MRYVSAILISVSLLLTGCDSGGGGSSAVMPPPVVRDDPLDPLDDVDYLGRLFPRADGWEVLGMNGDPLYILPLFASCNDSAKEGWSMAACVTSVSLDGDPADLSDLKPGQIVELHGQFKMAGFAYAVDELPGVAIDIRRTIVGPVEDVDADRAMLTVLGQRVYRADPAGLSPTIGDVVTVHGHFTADGEVLATLVEPYVGEPSYLVRGVLQALAPNRFAVGTLEVDLANATREGFPGGAPVAGDAVLVMADQPPAQGVLTASKVRCEGACRPARWENGWARGFITGWRSPTDFDVDGVTIRPHWCECVYGASPALGTYVDVSLFDNNAEPLLAPSTQDWLGLTGRITAIDPVTRELVVLGYRVQVSPATHISATPQESWYVDGLTFDELRVGDTVELSADALSLVLIAGSIVRQGDTPQVRAFPFTLNDPFIEVAGRSILTNAATQVNRCNEYTGLPALAISRDEFFATDWKLYYTSLAITVDPDTSPLVAQQIIACPLADF